MSTPAHRPYPPRIDDPQPPQENFSAAFAPEQPWIGESSPPLSPGSYDRLARSIVSEHRRLQRERDPRYRPLPPAQMQKPANWKLPATIVGTVLFASATSYYAIDRIWLQKMPSSMGDQIIQLAATAQKRNPADPRLITDGAVMESEDEILVGAVAEGPTEGASAVISGLTPGTVLSNGTPWGATGWILPAGELAQTTIRPPKEFKGSMEYSVTLKRADNTVIDQKNIRLDWNSKPESAVAKTAAEPVKKVQTTSIPRTQTEQAPPAPPPVEMAAEEVALILKRGEKMLMSGDLAGARLLFRRAADARSADAAYALAATYDPVVLRRLGVLGVSPDIASARDWYEKAREYGSKEAPKRLEELVSLGR